MDNIRKNPVDFARIIMKDAPEILACTNDLIVYDAVVRGTIYVAAFRKCPKCDWAESGINVADLPDEG